MTEERRDDPEYRRLKAVLDDNWKKYQEFQAQMKWICDNCSSDFSEPLKPDFGPDESWVCPFCNSKDIREKNKQIFQ